MRLYNLPTGILNLFVAVLSFEIQRKNPGHFLMLYQGRQFFHYNGVVIRRFGVNFKGILAFIAFVNKHFSWLLLA